MSLKVVAGLLFREGRVLACQRRKDALFPLKWEFPGGKVEEGETDFAALQRELHEELAIEVDFATAILRYTYRYPGWQEVELVFYQVNEYRGEIVNRCFNSLQWLRPAQLGGLDFLAGDLPFIQKLQRGEIEF